MCGKLSNPSRWKSMSLASSIKFLYYTVSTAHPEEPLSPNQKQRLIKLLKESDDNYVREKVIILLLINDGKTYRQISEFMEITYTTVAY
jgi:DNA-binding NarL/FixJ family response regulator